MTLEVTCAKDIDNLVGQGLRIGILYHKENKNAIPPKLGDWDIRFVASPTDDPRDSGIVAVPTNARTREIYNAGRKVWLHALGYDDAMAWLYIRSSQSHMHRWEDVVAEFVKANYDMDLKVWYDILDADYSMTVAEEKGLTVPEGMKRARFVAAMGIVMAMRTYKSPTTAAQG